MHAHEWVTAVLLSAAFGVALRAEAADRASVNKGLEMSIQLDRTSTRVGEPVVLGVVIRNTKREEVSLGMSVHDQASFDIEVRYVGGGMTQAGRMPLTKYGARRFSAFGAAKNIEIRLKGLEERRYRFPLSRMYDLTLSGTYSVKVNRLIPGRPRYDGEGRLLPTNLRDGGGAGLQ